MHQKTRLTPPLKPTKTPPGTEIQFSLGKCEATRSNGGSDVARERTGVPTSSRRDSLGRDCVNGSLTGLFALLQVVNEREGKKPQPQKAIGAAAVTEHPHPETCGNKFCTKFQESPAGEWSRRKIAGSYLWLCGHCSKAYVKKQYCEYCKQIYTDTSDKGAVVDGLDWIQCESCKRWTHVHCEEEHGTKKDLDTLLLDPLFVFHCAECEKANPFGKRGAKKKLVAIAAGHSTQA